MRVETIEIDGVKRRHYIADPDEMVIAVGPVSHIVTTQDGTDYDLSPDFVAVKPEHHAEVLHSIHEAKHNDPADPFEYTDELRAHTDEVSRTAVEDFRNQSQES